MPIKINLLAEQQQAEELRRKDPVKRAAFAGGAAVALLLGWYGLMHVQGYTVASNLKSQEERLAEIEKKSQKAIAALKQSVELEAKLKALQTLATNRFLWANALDSLQHTTVPGIQITRVKGRQNYVVDPAPTDPKAPKKPRASTEQMVVSIEARDFAENAALNHTKLMAEVSKAKVFSETLRQADSIVLKERTQPQPDPLDPARSFIRFVIECHFPETKRTL